MRIRIVKWLPVFLMMLVIFLVSARSSSELPNFAQVDAIVKKGGHMIGYALLALLCWRALDLKAEKLWVAWLLAILYALTDEYHQSFVPGRHPTLWDVILFDNIGALISLWLASLFRKQKRPEQIHAVAEDLKLKR